MKLFRLGLVPAAFSQAVYHVLAREGVEALLVLSPAEPYVCIGCFQNAEDCVDLEFCRIRSIPVLRREVGGGVVLIDSGQLFYQVVLKTHNPLLPFSVGAMYEKFSQAPVETYRQFGIGAKHRPVNDIVTNEGKKISGQGVADIGPCHVFVGNIILDFDYETMTRALKVPDEKFRDKVYKTMTQNLTTMKRELGYVPDREAVASALITEFEKLLGPLEEAMIPGELMPAIEEMGRRLQSPEFVRGRMTRAARTLKVREGVRVGHGDFKAPGGLISAVVEVEGGKINDLEVS